MKNKLLILMGIILCLFVPLTTYILNHTHPIHTTQRQAQEKEDTMPSIEVITQSNGKFIIAERGTSSCAEGSLKEVISEYVNKEKPSYEIALEEGLNLLEMGTGKTWILKGIYLDKSYIRDYLCTKVMGQLQENSLETKYCELYWDGEYRGLYLLQEKEGTEEDRLNLMPASQAYGQTSYIVKMRENTIAGRVLDNFTRYTKIFREEDGRKFYIEYPLADELTEEHIHFITDDFSTFEKSIYSHDYNDKSYGYQKWLDVQSFVDYYILNEFYGNTYGAASYTYFYKNIEGKIGIGVTAYETAFNNNYMKQDDATSFYINNNLYFEMLLKDKDFVERVISRYEQLRETVLSEAALEASIDEIDGFIQAARLRNEQLYTNLYVYDQNDLSKSSYFKRIGKNILYPLDRNPQDHEEAVKELKEYIATRGKWMDEHIKILKQFCHPSAIRKYAE